MNAEKWHHSEIRIAINDESQRSIAKNLRRDELLYYAFIIHSAGERIFTIGEHLAKLRAKSLTVSYTPFALHFCPQRCRCRQISWITRGSQYTLWSLYTFGLCSPRSEFFKKWEKPVEILLIMYYRHKLLFSVVMLTGRLMWVNYQEISNFCRPVLTYWLTDWCRQWLTDCWSCTAFCCDSFSLLRPFCTVGHGIFYMANVNNFSLVN